MVQFSLNFPNPEICLYFFSRGLQEHELVIRIGFFVAVVVVGLVAVVFASCVFVVGTNDIASAVFYHSYLKK